MKHLDSRHFRKFLPYVTNDKITFRLFLNESVGDKHPTIGKRRILFVYPFKWFKSASLNRPRHRHYRIGVRVLRLASFYAPQPIQFQTIRRIVERQPA